MSFPSPVNTQEKCVYIRHLNKRVQKMQEIGKLPCDDQWSKKAYSFIIFLKRWPGLTQNFFV
jgi:hypothetical protein